MNKLSKIFLVIIILLVIAFAILLNLYINLRVNAKNGLDALLETAEELWRIKTEYNIV